MKVFQRETRLRTAGWLAVRDITEEVTEAVKESAVQDGIVCFRGIGESRSITPRSGRHRRRNGSCGNGPSGSSSPTPSIM